MNPTPPRHRGRRLALVLGLVLTGALSLGVASAPAFENPNDASCFGHIQRGIKEDFDQPGDTEIRYSFSCTTPILGYSIESNVPVTGFDASTLSYDGADHPIGTDAFTCNGSFPGWSVNCIGAYGASLVNNKLERVVGQFQTGAKLCDEPREDPLLTIAYATGDNKGVVTQYIAGPFDLGRPYGCKSDAQAGKLRAPEDIDTSDTSDTSATTSAKKKAAARKAAAKKAAAKRAAARKARTKKVARGR